MLSVQQLLDQKPKGIHSIGPDEPVLAAIRKMAEHHIGALLVMSGDKLVGIVSERDYARKIALMGRTSSATQVRDIMSTKVICARLDQTVEECMAVMTARAVRHLPVLDHKNVVGMVSIGDLVKAIISDQKFVIERLEHYIYGGH